MMLTEIGTIWKDVVVVYFRRYLGIYKDKQTS